MEQTFDSTIKSLKYNQYCHLLNNDKANKQNRNKGAKSLNNLRWHNQSVMIDHTTLRMGRRWLNAQLGLL